MRLFSDASSDVADPWLRHAYLLAENGRGTTAPNPLVGCVVVRDGAIVGEGWHERAGGPHAEVNALAQAGDRARGATAYVTLEPCNHTGRTAPCTLALVSAGVRAVIVGMPDPNPSVAGGGADALRAAGIHVTYAEDAAPFAEQNEAWLKHVRTGLPWVRVKTALTLDGHASLKQGARSELTGDGAQTLTMRLRSAADAVVVGGGTLSVDEPALTVRAADGSPAARQPLRAVLSRTRVPSAGARVFTDGLGPSLALVGSTASSNQVDALRDHGVRVERYDADGGIDAALAVLGALDLTSVLVEAGPGLFEALAGAGAVDELVLYHAGVCAGAVAPALTQGRPAARLRAVEAGVIEGDAVTVWRPLDGPTNDTERE